MRILFRFSVGIAFFLISEYGNSFVQADERKYNFNLDKTSLEKNIFKIAKTAKIQIFFLPELIKNKTIQQKIYGKFTLEEALNQLLKGTGLIFISNKFDAIIIKQKTQSKELVFNKEQLIDDRYETAGYDIEEIITIGTRRYGRSVLTSAVPIDILGESDLERTGYVDLNDAFRTLLPSFNAKRLALNDGASLVRPITMRNSPADHVLLLMNGKRRHRSATIMIGTGHATTSGSQGQDYNIIPAIALQKIEILRDGAAALYGSDAIAGVINMGIKNQDSGGGITSHIGQYYQFGGVTFDLQANIGLALPQEGFLNLSAQYTSQSKTNPPNQHLGAIALQKIGLTQKEGLGINLGEPDYQTIKTVWNGGMRFEGGIQAYLFGNYMQGESEIGFFYRLSRDIAGLKAHVSFKDSLYDETLNHPDKFDLSKVYPAGYTPRFSGKQSDFSTVFGVKKEQFGDLNWDFSMRFGQNKITYHIENTINPSLGVSSPTSFDLGGLMQREFQTNLEITHEFAMEGIFSDILLLTGMSYRTESYIISEGQVESYAIGPLKDLPAGANGFQGYSPDIAGHFSGDRYAFYMDLETDITQNWMMSAAIRYENHTAFDDNFSYRFSTRYKINDGWFIRGSLSTGFRVPTVGQLYSTSQTSQTNSNADFILNTILGVGTKSSKIFNAEDLKSETSFNLSAGIVAKIKDDFTITLDFFQFKVKDRLQLIEALQTTENQRLQLGKIGYPNGENVTEVRFFQNSLNTSVRGIDLVIHYILSDEGDDKAELSLLLNYADQNLLSSSIKYPFSVGKKYEFEEGIPKLGGSLSYHQKWGDFDFLAQATFYGSWKRFSVVQPSSFLKRSPAVIFDAQLQYNIIGGVYVHIGARNLLNKKPPLREEILRNNGITYDNQSVFGISGGYYYAGLKVHF